MNLEQFLDACSCTCNVILHVFDDNDNTVCKIQLDHVDIISLRLTIPQLMSYRVGCINAVDHIIHADIYKDI